MAANDIDKSYTIRNFSEFSDTFVKDLTPAFQQEDDNQSVFSSKDYAAVPVAYRPQHSPAMPKATVDTLIKRSYPPIKHFKIPDCKMTKENVSERGKNIPQKDVDFDPGNTAEALYKFENKICKSPTESKQALKKDDISQSGSKHPETNLKNIAVPGCNSSSKQIKNNVTRQNANNAKHRKRSENVLRNKFVEKKTVIKMNSSKSRKQELEKQDISEATSLNLLVVSGYNCSLKHAIEEINCDIPISRTNQNAAGVRYEQSSQNTEKEHVERSDSKSIGQQLKKQDTSQAGSKYTEVPIKRFVVPSYNPFTKIEKINYNTSARAMNRNVNLVQHRHRSENEKKNETAVNSDEDTDTKSRKKEYVFIDAHNFEKYKNNLKESPTDFAINHPRVITTEVRSHNKCNRQQSTVLGTKTQNHTDKYKNRLEESRKLSTEASDKSRITNSETMNENFNTKAKTCTYEKDDDSKRCTDTNYKILKPISMNNDDSKPQTCQSSSSATNKFDVKNIGLFMENLNNNNKEKEIKCLKLLYDQMTFNDKNEPSISDTVKRKTNCPKFHSDQVEYSIVKDKFKDDGDSQSQRRKIGNSERLNVSETVTDNLNLRRISTLKEINKEIYRIIKDNDASPNAKNLMEKNSSQSIDLVQREKRKEIFNKKKRDGQNRKTESCSGGKQLNPQSEALDAFNECGKELSHYIIGSCHTRISLLLYYEEWKTTRTNLILCLESAIKDLNASNRLDWWQQICDVFVGVINIAGVIPTSASPVFAAASKVCGVVMPLVCKYFSKEQKSEEYGLISVFAEDREYTAGLIDAGFRCHREFQETRRIVGKLHAKIKLGEFGTIQDPVIRSFLQGISEYNPEHNAFYRRVKIAFDALVENKDTNTKNLLCEALKFYPESLYVIDKLNWQFNSEVFNSSLLEKELQKLREKFQTGCESLKKDLTEKILNVIRLLQKEQRTVENMFATIRNM